MKLFRAGIKTTSRRFSANCKITRSAAGHLVHHGRHMRQKALRLGVSLRIYYVTQQQHDTASAALLLPWGEFAGRGTREQFSDLHLFGTWSRPIDGVGEGFAKRAHSTAYKIPPRARRFSDQQPRRAHSQCTRRAVICRRRDALHAKCMMYLTTAHLCNHRGRLGEQSALDRRVLWIRCICSASAHTART
jgi:hypothetical protein